jgi:hypothetical protein
MPSSFAAVMTSLTEPMRLLCPGTHAAHDALFGDHNRVGLHMLDQAPCTVACDNPAERRHGSASNATRNASVRLSPSATPHLIGVGFFRACLLAELPSRAFLLSCERDARAPSTRDAGNAGVSPAVPTTREKTYPFEPLGSPPLREGNRERRAYSVPPACRGNLKEGVINCCFFVNFGLAIGIIWRRHLRILWARRHAKALLAQNTISENWV